jgi:hypothetical protein
MTGGTLHLRNCVFVTGAHGVVAAGTTLDIRDCRFEEYMSEALLLKDCAGTIASSSLRGDGFFLSALSSRNLVLEDLLMAFACFGGVSIDGGSVTARGITLVMAGMVPDADSTAFTVKGGGRVTLERCVIAENRGYGIHCRAGGQVIVRCSDLFGNTAGNYEGCPNMTGKDGNIAADPRFCSIPDSNFRLQASSPARTAACGSMGFSGELPCVLGGNDAGFLLGRRAGQQERADRHQPH